MVTQDFIYINTNYKIVELGVGCEGKWARWVDGGEDCWILRIESKVYGQNQSCPQRGTRFTRF